MRTLVAVHEAGHAVAAALLGARTGYVTIVPIGRMAGHCRMPLPDGIESGAIALMAAAGDIAVELYRKGGVVLLDSLLHRYLGTEAPEAPSAELAAYLAGDAMKWNRALP